MQFSVNIGTPGAQRTACAIVPLFAGTILTGAIAKLDKRSRDRIQAAVRSGDASAKVGRTLFLPDAKTRLLLVGCGSKKTFNNKRLAQAISSAAAALANSGTRNAISFLGFDGAGDSYEVARTTVQAFRSAIYRFSEFKSKPEPKPKLAKLAIAYPEKSDRIDAERGIADGTAIANGTDLARNLGNRPPNVCTPSHLADVAKDIAKRHKNVTVKALSERDMKRLEMGALLSVTRGAAEPAQVIVIEYSGAEKTSKPIALCGKGVTFDTGGISLKPPSKMDEMKFDMCGAASVLGTMLSVAELQLKTNVVAVVPACENMPGSQATRPGDIVTSMSGQTIEVINTDAEGRMILCDALTYVQRYKPRCIIDVATLTGACVVALGPLYTGVFSTDGELSTALLEAGTEALDEAWPMPVNDEYGESLRSNFADFSNSGGREGGASIAAQFLSRFVDNVPWAHLDIAGVAWLANASKGATGRPVPLLVNYLLNNQVP